MEHPWKIENTVVPIIVFFILLGLSLVLRGKGKYNYYALKRGWILLSIACVFFYFGLDDDNDYLRIFHGMWHTFGNLASFYLW